MKTIASLVAVLFLGFGISNGVAKSFHVGPRQNFHSISDVPWESLQAGDEVQIDWRAEPYKEKFVLCCKGTEKAPIIVRGIPGPKGELPVIDGNGARTRPQLQYWGEIRGTVKIGGAVVPKGLGAEHILIENLEIRGARPPYTFTNSKGQTNSYTFKSAALWVEKAYHLTVRNCILTDSAQGFFVSSNDGSASSDILVERCHFFDNGAEGHGHSIYTEAIGITFQYNHLGPLRAKCVGNNLKDRSCGLVVRYNWIEGGDKQLDLVDAEDSVLIRKQPSYHKTFVYGNVFIKTPSAHNQVVHYGGDSSHTDNYRKGTLYFYNNTIVSSRKDPANVFWLSTDDEQCDFRNNIICATTAAKFYPLRDLGKIRLTHNVLPETWLSTSVHGTVTDDGTSLRLKDPGFSDLNAQDFRLQPGSKCRDAGTMLLPECLPLNAPVEEYVKHRNFRPRPKDSHLDIGAFEFER